MDGGNAIDHIARTHATHGTTSLLATTVTATEQELLTAIKSLANYRQTKKPGGAKLLGVHLEGPYLDESKLGAQENKVRQFNFKEIFNLHQHCPLRILTIAVEKMPGPEEIKKFKKLKIVIQLGHSSCQYEEGLRSFQQGAKSFTHLFNAMSSFHHRAPGLAGVAMAHAEYSEIIPDLIHVHPGAILTAVRSIPKLYFVTDATAASSMPDGNYRLGGQIVHRCEGGVRLTDGTLAGSCLTMDMAFQNALNLGMSLEEASKRCSLYPAELIGEKKRGSLAKGQYADLVVAEISGGDNKILKVKSTFIEGEQC